jgi:alanyl-tRNA synthetase
MRDAHPELLEHAARVDRILDEEELRFTRTVEVGLKKLSEISAQITGKAPVSAVPSAPGELSAHIRGTSEDGGT